MNNSIINKVKNIALKSILKTPSLGRVGVGLLAVCLVSSCSDFFDPSPKDVMSTDEYITDESQVFKGMLGVMETMQNAGDQAIFLTDPRMNILETTDRAPSALQNIYNYDETNENEYADPTCYYKVIISCNDYISKINDYLVYIGGASATASSDSLSQVQYQNNLAVSETTAKCIRPLLSSTLRIKVWAYLMLGKIYGEAYWFDDPLNEKKELSDATVFTHCDMQQLTDKCLNLLENGIDVQGFHIPANLTMDWNTWFDNVTSEITTRQTYRKWQYLTPPYLLMKAELQSWKCNYLSEEAAQSQWLEIRDELLKYMYDLHMTADGVRLAIPGFESYLTVDGSNYQYTKNDNHESACLGYIYQTNIPLQSDATGAYYNIFYTEDVGSKWQVVSSIMYDYDNYQRNRIVQYFCPQWPGTDGFYLKPSQYAVNVKASDNDDTALYPEADIRSISQKMVMNNLGGENCISKYYYAYVATSRSYEYLRDNIFEIEPSIVLFRGHDFHFLIAEAENHLGNWDQAQTLLNGGITNRFPERYSETTWPESEYVTSGGWSQYYGTWFGSAGGYGDAGIAGVANGTLYATVKSNGDGTFTLNGNVITEQERKEYIDWCLAQEYSKEYVAEGKAYSYLCKMADRWCHAGRGSKTAAADKMADIICPKYQSNGKAAKVRSSLEGKYFINWDLKGESLSE